MTRVSFHFNVPQRLDYACRLLRKATRQNARVTVTGEARALDELDRALWSFEPTEFIPHVRLHEGETLSERLRETPVCLTVDPARAPHHVGSPWLLGWAPPNAGHEVGVEFLLRHERTKSFRALSDVFRSACLLERLKHGCSLSGGAGRAWTSLKCGRVKSGGNLRRDRRRSPAGLAE